MQDLLKPTDSNAGQMVRTAIAGVVATVFDYTAMLAAHVIAHASDAIAVTAGYGVGTVVTYLSSILYIFPHRNIKNKRLEFAIFAVISAIGWALTEVIVKFGVAAMMHYSLAGQLAEASRLLLLQIMTMFGPHTLDIDTTRLMIAKAVSIVIVFFFNFASRKMLLFRAPQNS